MVDSKKLIDSVKSVKYGATVPTKTKKGATIPPKPKPKPDRDSKDK